MTRICCVIIVLISLSMNGAPLDFKFDPNVRRPVETPMQYTVGNEGYRVGVGEIN
jgi:hypothetical protein